MENKQPELLILPLQLVNDILSYLGTKPYTESAPYINAIQKEAKVFTPNEVPTKEVDPTPLSE